MHRTLEAAIVVCILSMLACGPTDNGVKDPNVEIVTLNCVDIAPHFYEQYPNAATLQYSYSGVTYVVSSSTVSEFDGPVTVAVGLGDCTAGLVTSSTLNEIEPLAIVANNHNVWWPIPGMYAIYSANTTSGYTTINNNEYFDNYEVKMSSFILFDARNGRIVEQFNSKPFVPKDGLISVFAEDLTWTEPNDYPENKFVLAYKIQSLSCTNEYFIGGDIGDPGSGYWSISCTKTTTQEVLHTYSIDP